MNEASRKGSQTADIDTPFAQFTTQPFTLWMQSGARLQAESMRFIADRVVKGLHVPQRLVACATPAEAVAVASEFTFEAARDYLDECQRLFALAAGDFESTTAAVI